ncbi:MAG: T9SS type A sorting domain-containing protein [Chitinophagales bacterium]|nr:T9SS type A sorting domain-containing protein [Chitinophagales bacterium]
MKRLPLFLLLFISVACFAQTETFHDFRGKTLLGVDLPFSTFYGKKVMAVNTATYCSFTYQYEELESLYTAYQDSNFMIIGFPCNDFGSQEPGADSTILEFCEETYNIDFQMMSKVTVLGANADDVYKWLQQASRNGVANATVGWNFNKFLIDEAGGWVAHYPSTTSPFDPAIINWLKSPSVIPPDTTDTGLRDELQIQLIRNEVVAGMLRLSFQNLPNHKTTIGLYSASGQFISTLHDGMLANGENITADLRSHSSGIYFLRVNSKQGSKSFRFALMN